MKVQNTIQIRWKCIQNLKQKKMTFDKNDIYKNAKKIYHPN